MDCESQKTSTSENIVTIGSSSFREICKLKKSSDYSIKPISMPTSTLLPACGLITHTHTHTTVTLSVHLVVEIHTYITQQLLISATTLPMQDQPQFAQ